MKVRDNKRPAKPVLRDSGVKNEAVILSERSESKDLRLLFGYFRKEQERGAHNVSRAS